MLGWIHHDLSSGSMRHRQFVRPGDIVDRILTPFPRS